MNQTVVGFIKKELIQALRDNRMRVLIFIAPLLQTCIFGLAIQTEIKNIQLSVMASPSDRLMSRIAQRAFASGWFIPAASHETDPFRQVQSGQADAVLVAPKEGLDAAVERGRGQVQYLVNASNVLKASAMENYMQAAIQEVVQDSASSLPSGAVPAIPLNLDIRILYNPELISSVFMVPNVIVFILCLVSIVLTAMALAREKEIGTFETLLASPAKPWEIMMGKTIPFIIIGFIDVPLVMCFGVFFFSVPVRGSILLLGLSSAVFLCTTVSVGIMISTLAKNQQQAMMGSFMFLFPAFMLSGIFFPVENMPSYLRFVAYLNPLKYFVAILRNIMLRGGDLSLVAYNLGVLILMGTLAVLFSYRRFHQTLD